MNAIPSQRPDSDRIPPRQLLEILAFGLLALVLTAVAGADISAPMQGSLRHTVELPDEHGELRTVIRELPLDETRVKARVSGPVAHVTVQQIFRNATEHRIEAVYQFPLPDDAAVHESVLRIGDRVIRAEIRERQEARRTYERAREQGRKASLLEQERPNIFTQSVANIEPGETIVAALQYVQEIPHEDGAWRFVFPMTIGPRFIPGAPAGRSGQGLAADTDRVPDASRISPPVVPPGLRSGRDIEVEVTVASGFAVREIASPSHEIDLAWLEGGVVRASLAAGDRIANKDLILEWTTIGPEMETTVLAHRTGETGTLLLMAQPPAVVTPSSAVPKELVFVLDCSGSMTGKPMAASKALMRRFLEGMNPRDSIQVIRFSEAASALSEAPLPNSPAARERARAYIDALEGMGGTHMLAGVRAALGFPRDPQRQRMVIFLTDGYIGNEREILAAIDEGVGEARLYALGVGSSTNRYLIEEMARSGGGFARYIRPDQDPEPLVESFFHRLDRPVLTGVDIDWGGLDVLEQEPDLLPDLFAGQPVFLVARYRRPGEATILIRGRTAQGEVSVPVRLRLPAREPSNDVLPLLWARRRIGSLMRLQHRGEIPEVREEITRLALDHRLMSKYTSFVAVERRLAADLRLPLDTILIPSEMPEGVSYEGIFGETTLSLAQMKPGDPVLAVRAPAEAVAVVASFPFGLRKRLVRDPETGLWICRFLVPRGQPEGRHTVRVRIVLPHGDWIETEAHYLVDATAPELEVDWTLEGAELRILARAMASETPGGRASAMVLSDVRSVVVRPPQGGLVVLEPEGPGRWAGSYRLPAWYRPGVYTFRLQALDGARNAALHEIAVRVPGGAR